MAGITVFKRMESYVEFADEYGDEHALFVVFCQLVIHVGTDFGWSHAL
jgi:hypothetical protein